MLISYFFSSYLEHKYQHYMFCGYNFFKKRIWREYKGISSFTFVGQSVKTKCKFMYDSNLYSISSIICFLVNDEACPSPQSMSIFNLFFFFLREHSTHSFI